METVRTEGLSKSFAGFKALTNVSLIVEEGERRAIIGPNGAGKTTLLKLITGELRPSTGRIYIFDQDVTTMPVHQRVHLGLGRTFQILNLFSNLTVLNSVVTAIQAFKHFRFGMFRSLSAYHSAFDEAQELLRLHGLWESRDTITKELSYGDQRRLEMVLCLSSNPRLVLLDEPTAGLTPADIVSFSAMIRSLGRDTTLIIVEHNMDAVFDLAERITVLHYGQVIAEGTKQEIKVDHRVREVYLGNEGKTEDARIS
jgi:branched-chain amino acid transport system ATP-binding protein